MDMAGDAVDDARRNALNNKISNAYFIPGPAEDMIPQMIGQASHDEIVAVLDPPRTGLHMKAIRQIRASRIKKVVYVSSDPKSCIKNFVDLARPSSTTFFGDPFLPVLVRPLDLFPHTNHFMTATESTEIATEATKYKDSLLSPDDGCITRLDSLLSYGNAFQK